MSASLARRPSRLGPLFTASIALNVLLLGVVGAHALRPSLAPPAAERHEGPLDRIVAALPAADAARARAVLDRERPQIEAARARLPAAQRAISVAIGRADYDEAALRAALLAWQGDWLDFSAVFRQAFLDVIRPLSADGRARAAETVADDARRHSRP